MKSELLHTFRLYGQLRSHRLAVDKAKVSVEKWLKQSSHPYCAFSAGKDSHCVLTLVRKQAPDTPAVYFDADCAYPEVKDTLLQTSNLLEVKADEPLIATIKRFGLHGGPALERATMQSTVYSPVKRLIREHWFDGVAYGLRAEESIGREMNAKTKGRVFQYKRDGIWACQPIAHWTYFDVWAFIVANDLPYCKVYDRMWDMPQREQRISYWAGETNRENGRYVWLKRNYPELWNRLAGEIPDVRSYA